MNNCQEYYQKNPIKIKTNILFKYSTWTSKPRCAFCYDLLVPDIVNNKVKFFKNCEKCKCPELPFSKKKRVQDISDI